jgi:ankyrin repeat protein
VKVEIKMKHAMKKLTLGWAAGLLLVAGCAKDKKSVETKAAPPAPPVTVAQYLDQSGDFYDSTPVTFCSAIKPRNPTEQQLATYRISENAKTKGIQRFFTFLTAHPEELSKRDPKSGETIIHTLVAHDQVDLVKVMIDENFSVGLAQRDALDRYPAHYIRSKRMAELLLNLPLLTDINRPGGSRAAVVNSPDKNGQTILHRVVLNADAEGVAYVVGTLCSQFRWFWEANPMNAKDAAGRTALQLAVLAGLNESVEALIQCGSVDVIAQDGKGNTALHAAYSCENQEAMILIAGLRPNVDLRNSAGRLPKEALASECAKVQK